MSLDNVIAFWQKVQNDRSLREKLGAETNVARVTEIAKQAGFACTADELMAADSVIRFWTHVANDSSVRDELSAAKNLDANAASKEIVRVAARHGFAFTAEQMIVVTPTLMAAGNAASGELDAAALSNVTGGVQAQGKDVSASLKSAISGQLSPDMRIGGGLVPALHI